LSEVISSLSKRRLMAVLLTSTALSLIHLGQWLLLVLCAVPVLVCWGAIRRSWRAVVLVCGALLIPGLPLLYITASQPNHVMEQMGSLFLWEMQSYTVVGRSFQILNPKEYVWMLGAAAGMSLLAAVRTRQRFHLGFVIAVFVMARQTLNTGHARLLFAICLCCGGFVTLKSRIGQGIDTAQGNREVLSKSRELREVLSVTVPKGALIAADPETSQMISAVRRAAVMAPLLGNSNPADPGVIRRAGEAAELLAADTARERREEIIRSNGIQFILARTDRGRGKTNFDNVGELVAQQPWFRLYRVVGSRSKGFSSAPGEL
jgi:hypothetical protein